MPRVAKGPIPPSLRWIIWERDNFTCHYCGARRSLSVDHKVPESKGGTLDPLNLLTACGRCNSRKGSKSYEEFVSELKSDPAERLTIALPAFLKSGKFGRRVKRCGMLTVGEAEYFVREQARRKGRVSPKKKQAIRFLAARFGDELTNRFDFDLSAVLDSPQISKR